MSLSTKDADLEKGSDAPFAFFALLLALSLPIWIVGAVVDQELMPGLPLAGLMFVCPTLAAVLIHLWKSGPRRTTAFLFRAFDIQRLRSPFVIVPLLLIHPGLFAASYVIQQGLGEHLPPPDIALLPILGLLGAFLVAGLLEELGWTGYALEPLQRRWGALPASLVIGSVWAAWHLVPLTQADRSIEWMAWWSVWTVATRMVMVWLYNHAGPSVLGMALVHAMSNVCWQVYPVHGSYFDPRITGLVTLALAIALFWPWARVRPAG